MNIVPVSVVALGALAAVAEPALGNPLLNFVVVLTKTIFQVTHGVAFSYPARMSKRLDFHDHGCLCPPQALGDGASRNLAKKPVQGVNLLHCLWATVLVHGQTQTPRLALNEPFGEAGLSGHLPDDEASLMKPAVVVGAHVSLVLRQPLVFQVVAASPARPALPAESSSHRGTIFPTFFDWASAVMASHFRLPALAHPLAVVRAFFPNMFGSSLFLAAIWLGLKGSAVERASG